jgi:hypothetical protein
VGRCGNDFRWALAAADDLTGCSAKTRTNGLAPGKANLLKVAFAADEGFEMARERHHPAENAAGRRAHGCKGLRMWLSPSTDE